MKPEEIEKLLALTETGDAEARRASRELIKKLLIEEVSESEKEVKINETERRQKLPSLYRSLMVKHAFKPGDLVQWKKGIRNRRIPDDNEAAIVIQVLSEPILDSDREPGSTYFREPLDIILGIMIEDGDFVTFYFDSRRFEPIT